MESQDDQKWDKIRTFIDEMLLTLDKDQQEAIRLNFLEGKKQEEVAKIMGIARGTVASRISRGLGVIRQKLKNRGVVVSITLLTSLMTSRLRAEVTNEVLAAVEEGVLHQKKL